MNEGIDGSSEPNDFQVGRQSLSQKYINLRPSLESLGLSQEVIIGDLSQNTDQTNEVMCNNSEPSCSQTEGLIDLEGIDDDELDSYILSDSEAELKSKIWMEANEQFLKDREELRQRRADEETEKRGKEGVIKRPRKRRKAAAAQPAATASEAIERMIQGKKLSAKINYEVLKSLTSISDTLQDESKSLKGKILHN